MTALTEKDERRFLAKVGLPDENGCMPWLAGVGSHGYGNFFPTKSTALLAHRVMHDLMVGPIPAGLQVDHVCGVRTCVAPDHLRAVTPKQNQENRGASRNSRSGMRGAYPHKSTGKWQAQVGHNGQYVHLGLFDRLEDAAAAAQAARNELYTHNDRDRVAS